MSLSFQERFKNRTSQIDRFGSLNVSASVSISRPLENQLFNNENLLEKTNNLGVLRRSCIIPPKPIDNSPRLPPPAEASPRKQTQSAKPFREQIQEPQILSKIARPVAGSSLDQDFKPYTYRDYQAIKPKNYYQLGGLGPSHVGTDDWVAKKNVVTRRTDYNKLLESQKNGVPFSGGRKTGEKSAFVSGAGKILGYSTPSIYEMMERLEKKKGVL